MNRSDIDNCERDIKLIGRKYAGNNYTASQEQLSSDVSTIYDIMLKYNNKKQIQRVCCHTISNMAINQNNCESLMDKELHLLIERAINRHNDNDWKVCWLGFSAIWNLARPENMRERFTKSIIKLSFQSLKRWKDDTENAYLVCETVLGALSNLMLNENLRENIKRKDLNLICKVIDKGVKCPVLIAGAGLLTNLAHNNGIGDILDEFNAIEIVLNKMEIFSHDSHLLRNSCAALSNLTTVDNYLECFLNNKGVERVLSALNVGRLSDTSIITLAEQALLLTGINLDTMKKTTSLHISVQKSLKNSIDKCLLNGIDINEIDTLKNTPLHYAITNNDFEIVRYLVSRGSNIYLTNDEIDEMKDEIKDAIKTGIKDLKEFHKKRSKHITESSSLIPDLSMIVSSYENPIDVWGLF